MKILAVCGSPRSGNTEWMLERVLEGASKNGATTELLLLRELDIKMCDGCLSCEVGGDDRKGICKVEDDMQGILPRLLEADVLVLGTPVYFEMLSGLLKNFMDRTCPIWTKMKGKNIAGVAVAEEDIGSAVENLKAYCKVCKMNWMGEVTALAKKKREVAQDSKTGKSLIELGERLAK